MRIITKKRINKIMKKLAENEIIGIKYVHDSNEYTKFSENNDDIAVEICGKIGIHMIQEYLEKEYLENFTDFENGIVNPITSLEEFQSIFENIDFDNSKIPQVQNYIKELYDLFISFSRLSELSEKGVLNTNEITEIAKALQYDGVVFSQIYDGIDEPSDVFVTFEEKQSAVIDIISAAQLKLEEEQRRAELFVDTRKNFYDTLKTLSEEQIDEYVDKSAFKL